MWCAVCGVWCVFLTPASLSSVVVLLFAVQSPPPFFCFSVAMGLENHERKRGLLESVEFQPRINLNVYEEHFEARFLKATKEFYDTESAHFTSTGSISDYVKKVSVCLCLFMCLCVRLRGPFCPPCRLCLPLIKALWWGLVLVRPWLDWKKKRRVCTSISTRVPHPKLLKWCVSA